MRLSQSPAPEAAASRLSYDPGVFEPMQLHHTAASTETDGNIPEQATPAQRNSLFDADTADGYLQVANSQ